MAVTCKKSKAGCSGVAVELRLEPFDFLEQAQEFPSEGCQSVFHAGRNLGVLDSLKYPGAREVPQPVVQDFGADAFNMTFESAGAPYTSGDRAQDADRPSAANDVFQQDIDAPGIQFRHLRQDFFVGVRH